MSRFALPLLALTIIAVCASQARADWTHVRDIVRKADATNDEAQKVRLLRKAYAAALESTKKAPTVSNEYLWLANAAGRLAQAVPIKERIALSKVVKVNAEKAISLDAKNGAAYMTLGAWHYFVANMSWVQRSAAKAFYGEIPPASFEKAIAYLSKALQYGAENPVEVLWLRGCAYDELDNDAKAAADFRACIARTPRNDKERGFQREAQERLD